MPKEGRQMSLRRRVSQRRGAVWPVLVAAVVVGAAVVAWLEAAFAGAQQSAAGARAQRIASRAAEASQTVAEAPTAAKGKCPYSKENMAMQGAPDAEEEGLLPGERYIAMNRFQVREGSEPQFEQRWAQRKSSLLTLDGFRWFGLLRRVPPSGEESASYPDDYTYVSFTIWETKKNFNSWRSGPAFKEAHGGGSPFDFFGMIINGFMTNKGPPKPAFWRGMLMEKTTAEKERLLCGPGGRPDADGSTVLDPEVFVSMNRFTVAAGKEQEFEQRWASRESKLKELPGFRFFQLMRRDQTPDDDVNYISMAAWDDRAAFDNWRQGDSFKKAHGDGSKQEDGAKAAAPMGSMLVRPPTPYFYEGKLVLESEPGP